MLHTKYQGSRASTFRQEVLSFLLGLAISDLKKKKFHRYLHRKTGYATWRSYFLKQSNNLNNSGRGCPTNHLCLILLKSDQKF